MNKIKIGQYIIDDWTVIDGSAIKDISVWRRLTAIKDISVWRRLTININNGERDCALYVYEPSYEHVIRIIPVLNFLWDEFEQINNMQYTFDNFDEAKIYTDKMLLKIARRQCFK